MSIHSTGLNKEEPRRGSLVTRGRSETPLPKYATIPDWCQISGLGRTVTYEWLARKILRAVKAGNRTLIDVPHGLEDMAGLPEAEITTGLKRRSSSGAGDRALSYRALHEERSRHRVMKERLRATEERLRTLEAQIGERGAP